MITLQKEDDAFSVDTEQTQRYDEAHSLCDCGYCRNYYAQIKGKLPKLDAFLVDEEPIRENERNANDLFIEYYLPPAAHFSSCWQKVCRRRQKQNEKSSVRLHRAFNHQIARVTLPERRHRVQTYTWRGVPLITALTRLTLGFQGRLERRWE